MIALNSIPRVMILQVVHREGWSWVEAPAQSGSRAKHICQGWAGPTACSIGTAEWLWCRWCWQSHWRSGHRDRTHTRQWSHSSSCQTTSCISKHRMINISNQSMRLLFKHLVIYGSKFCCPWIIHNLIPGASTRSLRGLLTLHRLDTLGPWVWLAPPTTAPALYLESCHVTVL